jgi:G3E family GTPase
LNRLKGILRKFNPVARLVLARHGQVDPSLILNTRLFDYQKAQQSAGWIQELQGIHTPETEEYGISSFVFRDPRPFHPQRLWDLVQSGWLPSVIRSKGTFWLASRPAEVLLLGQAGGSVQFERYGSWWGSVPKRERLKSPAYLADKDVIEARWHPTWEDRLNELVIIGTAMDRTEVERLLCGCLMTNDEVADYQLGRKYHDPWP